MSELAKAIHAWEAARDVAEDAREAWLAAQAARDVASDLSPDRLPARDAARDAARVALNAAVAREEEASRAAIALMPMGIPDADEISLDGAEGCVIGGRFYLRVGDWIRWMKVAAESPTQPSEDPDGDWKRCDMTCLGCKESGHVFSRIWESPWDGYKHMRYECRNCGDAWPIARDAP